jgi:serine/threonine protein kinase
MTISNYTLKEKLGEGGMAKVYLAEHNTLKQPVAVKLLNKEFVNNENIRKRFLSEGKNMFKMSHPNVIKVTDLIDQEDTVAIVMEYLDGETIKEYIEKNGKLSELELKHLFDQMLDAVAYVHDQGLVHRDIKPSNFMRSKKGAIKLLDFGIAKNTDKSSSEYTQTGTLQSMGTPMYMSPEQVKSTKDVTGQSDIYSLGVVFWQMVTGQKPYDTYTTSTFELQTKIVNDPLSITNTKFDGIIQKATSKSLTSRYKNCVEIKDDLLLNSLSHSSANKSSALGDAGDKTIVDYNPTQVKESSKSSTVGLPKESRSNFTPIEPKKGMKLDTIFLAFLGFVIIVIIFTMSSGSGETEVEATIDSIMPYPLADSIARPAYDTAMPVDSSSGISGDTMKYRK